MTSQFAAYDPIPCGCCTERVYESPFHHRRVQTAARFGLPAPILRRHAETDRDILGSTPVCLQRHGAETLGLLPHAPFPNAAD